MYVWSTLLSAEYDMDQPGVVARTSSEEVKRLNVVLRAVLNVPIFSFQMSEFLDP